MSKPRLIATAWLGYRQIVVPETASKTQLNETEMAFYAGAVTIYEIFMRSLDPEQECTDADMIMISDLHKEIREFGKRFDLQNMKTGGSA